MSASRALNCVVNIEDLRQLASRRVPKPIFDYVDGGAEAEATLRGNRAAWEQIYFKPRNAVDTPSPDLRTQVLGFDMALPLLLGPVGFTRLLNTQGEVAVASAAGESGIPFCMSSFSGYPCEAVAEANRDRAPLWYQLYLAGGRAIAEATLARVWKAGFRALAVTIDTNCPGMRERDLHNGVPQLMSGKPFDMLPYTWQIAKRPGWAMRFMADHDAMFFPNIQTPTGPAPATDVRQMLTGAVVTWQDLAWIRQAWPGPILAKGVITGDDALRALDHGCAGVIVSNHGGRQLDSCYPSLRALPEVIRQIKWKTTAIGTRPAIIVDGGIRRGGDILKAICLGADAVLIGRSYAYGLMAEGREGVAKAISILRADLERTLVLLGCPSLAELNASYIDAPKHW